MQYLTNLANSSRICPYCKDSFRLFSKTVHCVRCSTRYHRACWEERKACSVYGCQSLDNLEQTRRSLEPITWSSQYIRSRAIKGIAVWMIPPLLIFSIDYAVNQTLNYSNFNMVLLPLFYYVGEALAGFKLRQIPARWHLLPIRQKITVTLIGICFTAVVLWFLVQLIRDLSFLYND